MIRNHSTAALTMALAALTVGGIPAAVRAAAPLEADAISAEVVARTAPEPPPRQAPRVTVRLQQRWSPEQRTWFHHASQGTSTFDIPYEWFIALEQPHRLGTSAGLLSDPAYLERFGFIPSQRHTEYNPDDLPIGFARGGESVDAETWQVRKNPATGKSMTSIGLTCAACHTGSLDYQGTRIVIDGGPALTDLDGFGRVLAKSLLQTAGRPLMQFRRFANRVLGPNPQEKAILALHKEVTKTIAAGFITQLVNKHRIQGGVEEGYGRLDALNRIGNEVFANRLGDRDNIAPLTAPVAYPHIWDTPWFDWVQYNGSIEQPMVRNAGEALGVRALVNLSDPERGLYGSTIPFENLAAMEEQIGGKLALPGGGTPNGFPGLRAPAWPETILPKIDRQRAADGSRLYGELCRGCHLPPVNTTAFWDAKYWTEPNQEGLRFLKLPLIEIAELGTDPEQARGMKERTVRVPTFLGLEGGTVDGTVQTLPYGPALGEVVANTVKYWYDVRNVPPEERERVNGFRPNGIRAPLAYRARPLDGVWATPPFLHNGSVPNLYALLSPLAERPTRFFLGSREFNPIKVGYETKPFDGGFELDTTKAGNSNAGHVFDDGPKGNGIIGRRLSEDERMGLVEFLKTL